MASNIAARRAAKAIRRKAVVAEKRKAELQAGSLAGQVSQAVTMPIRHCLISEGWQDSGMATLILTRGVSASHLTMGCFLLDTLCLGIKDVIFRPVEGQEFDAYFAAASAAAPLSPVDPAYARKLLHDLAAWAASIGFPPHRNYAAAERFFGTVNAGECAAEFQFGHDGKPTYVPGPSESPQQIRRRLERFGERFGEADFGTLLLEGSDLQLEGS